MTASITTRVPAGVCEAALLTTLNSACSIRIASAAIIGSSGGKSSMKDNVAPRRFASGDDALDDFAQINPVPPQLKRAGIDPGNRQEIAYHLVETLGFGLDVPEKTELELVVELVPVIEQARR